MSDECMTEEEAARYCKETWGKDWWWHLQYMRLQGRVIETDYDSLLDRY